jgi:hypothetical protein
VTRTGDGRLTFVEAGRGPTAETDERAMGPAMVPAEEMSAAPGFAGRCTRTNLASCCEPCVLLLYGGPRGGPCEV